MKIFPSPTSPSPCFADAKIDQAFEIQDPSADPETGMMGVKRGDKLLALPLQRTKFDTVVVGISEDALIKADITVNKNMVPFDTRSPFVTSGIRIGTAAVTTRGLKEADMLAIVDLIDEVITSYQDDAVIEAVKEKVNAMMAGRPLFV